MLDSILSIPLVDNLLASGFVGVTKNIIVRLVRGLTKFALPFSHLGSSYQSIFLHLPRAKDKFTDAKDPGLVSYSFRCYLPGRRQPVYYHYVPDADYHSWWAWSFYLRGIDTMRKSYFDQSRQAFDRALEWRKRHDLQAEDDTTKLQRIKLEEVESLFPLLESAIRSRRRLFIIRHKLPEDEGILFTRVGNIKATLNLPGEKTVGVSEDPDAENDLKGVPISKHDTIVARHLAMVNHRCYTDEAFFSPDGLIRSDQRRRSDSRLDYVKKEGLQFYQHAIEGKYHEKNFMPGYEAQRGLLEDRKKALEKEEKVPARGRITRCLDWWAPLSSFVLLLVTLGLVGLETSDILYQKLRGWNIPEIVAQVTHVGLGPIIISLVLEGVFLFLLIRRLRAPGPSAINVEGKQ